MSYLTNQLRLMVAAPHMLAALEKLLPLIKQEYEELETVAMYNNDEPGPAQDCADTWLDAVMSVEFAIEKAKPPEELSPPEVPCDSPTRARTGVQIQNRGANRGAAQPETAPGKPRDEEAAEALLLQMPATWRIQ